MKYTSLFSAVAIAAAMGTQALATVSTNNQVRIDFEGNSYPVGTMASAQLTGWTVQTEDQSEIIAAPLSSADAVAGYTDNKHLKLNTEGQELTWVPATYTEKKAIVEMKVRLVASDTAPAITDTDVHAAVYLQVDENNPSNDGLYAYTLTGWDKLDTTAFNTNLTTGSMIALRVLMNYNTEAKEVTFEGALLTGAENEVPVYHNLGTKYMSNPTTAVGEKQTLKSISFKGTGGVDDLFVGGIEETPSSASISLELYDGEAWGEFASGTLDTSNANIAFESIIEMESGKDATVTVWSSPVGAEPLATLTGVLNANGELHVSCEDWNGFQPETSYIIRVAFTDPSAALPATFSIGDADTQAALATAGVDPVAMDGNYFIVNVIEPDGATASLLVADSLTSSFTAAPAGSVTRTVKTGYTELKYEIPANETAKFFKVKFTK